MAKNDLILIDSIIEERVSENLPSNRKDEVFEFLSYEQVLKEYDLSADDIKSGSVDGRNDGGIDSIYILVNGHLISDVKNALLPKSNANLEVFFFTCKHRDVFKQDPVNSICTSLQELLDFSKENKNLDYITIVEKDNGKKLNINSFIGKEEINKDSKNDNINVTVIKIVSTLGLGFFLVIAS